MGARVKLDGGAGFEGGGADGCKVVGGDCRPTAIGATPKKLLSLSANELNPIKLNHELRAERQRHARVRRRRVYR